MNKIFEVVYNLFEEDDWNFEVIKDGEALKLEVSAENGNYKCHAIADEETQTFRFYSIAPIKVPQFKRKEIADFIARANYGLILGNFELDMDDGEVRFKTSSYQSNMPLNFEVCKRLVYLNVKTLDDYFLGIMKVTYGDAYPEEAISLIEENFDNNGVH